MWKASPVSESASAASWISGAIAVRARGREHAELVAAHPIGGAGAGECGLESLAEAGEEPRRRRGGRRCRCTA